MGNLADGLHGDVERWSGGRDFRTERIDPTASVPAERARLGGWRGFQDWTVP
jgi:hypothetical protein